MLNIIRQYTNDLLLTLNYKIRLTPNGLEAIRIDKPNNLIKEFVIYTDLKSPKSKVYLYYIYYDNTYEYEICSNRLELNDKDLSEIKGAVLILDSLS